MSNQDSSSQTPARVVRTQGRIIPQPVSTNVGSSARPAANAANTPNIWRILQLVWTTHLRWWKWTIPLGILIGVVAASTIWWNRVPQYSAEAKLRIKARRPHIVFEDRGNSGVFLRTQLQLFRTRAILSPAVEDIMRDVPKVKEMEDPLAWLEKGIRTGVISGSELVGIQFSDPDPETAKKVLEAVVRSYMNYHRRYDRMNSQGIVSMLNEEKARREKVVIEMRNEVRDLARKAGVSLGGLETSRISYDSASPLQAVHDLLIQTDVDIEIAKAELAAMKRLDTTPNEEIPEYELRANHRISAHGVRTETGDCRDFRQTQELGKDCDFGDADGGLSTVETAA